MWTATSPHVQFPALEGKISVDVAVIGAGITGLTAAALLKRAGKTVAVIDKSDVAAQDSAYTTAHLTEVFDTRYHDLVQNFGREGARLAAHSSRRAIERIATFVRELKAACEFRRLSGYLFSESEGDLSELECEVEAAKEIGVEAELVDDIPLPFRVKAAIRFPNQAQFHPRKYLVALAKNIPGEGSYVFERSCVRHTRDGDPCWVKTDSGTVTARDVVLATHTPIATDLFFETKMASYRSYAVAAQLSPDASIDGLFWGTEDPYHYIRSYSVSGRNREALVIVGGEDHKTGKQEETKRCYDRLEEYIRSRFDVGSIRHRWSGQISQPIDGLPFIGRSHLAEHFYVATGYSGTGMTFGTLAAMIISDAILGHDNPWGALYDARRVKPIASLANYLFENRDYPTYFLFDHLVAPGSAPICTHMGCRLHRNEAEKSWDCPCHGSRFDSGGRVLNGPALKDLER